MYLLRLDDASEYMDEKKWSCMERLLEQYKISPIVGIIPENKDGSLINKYNYNSIFWEKAGEWKDKGWTIAMHGCYHKFITEQRGIHPVNNYSEFAGIALEEQIDMITHGISILNYHKIEPELFFAPAHTFDINTLTALKNSKLNIVSDTIASDIYFSNGIYFIPQQTGKARSLPFKVTTFCYHPNNMKKSDFIELEKFIKMHKDQFGSFKELEFRNRKRNCFDIFIKEVYFFIKVLRKHI